MATATVAIYSLHDHAMNTALQWLALNLSYQDYWVLAVLFVGTSASLTRGTFWDTTDPLHYKWFERPQASCRTASLSTRRTRNIAQKLEEDGRDLVIFWGSQSGTAEGFSHRLARDFQTRLRLNTLVADLDDYDSDTISLIPDGKYAVFILSTYGDGDPSDNSAAFLKWLKAKPATALPSLRYAAFGLGNSNYRYYNKVIDDLVAGMTELGALSLLSVGKANDANRTTEEDFVEWKDALMGSFALTGGLESHLPEHEPIIEVTEMNFAGGTDDFQTLSAESSHTPHQTSSAPVSAPVTKCRELTSNTSNVGGCMHLEVDLSFNPTIKYKTGDHLAVWARNSDTEVQRLINILGIGSKADHHVTIRSLDSQQMLKVPSPIIVRTLLQDHLEICAPVPRETLSILAQYSPTPEAKSILEHFANNKDAYTSHLAQNLTTLSRLLEYALKDDPIASWSSLPLAVVIECLRPMTPRYYSISSSSVTLPRRVAITVSTKPTTSASSTNVLIPGLARTYLSSLLSPEQQLGSTSTKLRAQVRRSTFKLPFSPAVPIVMVAAGTGIAPFRGFMQERARLASTGRDVGHMMLFFGCQSPEIDHLYADEFAELQAGPLKAKLRIVTAFSRVKGLKKTYVQDRIREHSEAVCKALLRQEAGFYVCGSATMARQVARVVEDVVQNAQQWTADEVRAWRTNRRGVKRWHEDVWG